MKVDRHGASTVLSEEQLDALLDAAPSPNHRCLWALQRWTAARIGEALALQWGDINGSVTYRKANTKMKRTHQVPTHPRLQKELDSYRRFWQQVHGHAPAKDEVLFPGRSSTTSPMSRQAADLALRKTCDALGLQGVSTHSFRRSLATNAVHRGVSLPAIQRVTGHKDLGSLGYYLEAGEEEVMAAIAADWEA